LPPPPEEAPSWVAPLSGATLSDEQFAALGAFIERTCGVRVAAGKKVMLEGRLRRRLRARGLDDFTDYCRLVLSGGAEDEVRLMIDEVTTNKTDFFREPQHFDYLTGHALPALLRSSGGLGEVRIWSAACSTGEEPFTLAMVLAEAALKAPGLRYEVLASDISTEVLAQAKSATYLEDRVDPVPLALRQKYLLRRRDGTPQVRVVPALRERVRFRRINLLDSDYALGAPLDAIFCRNVFIYFRRELQAAIVDRFFTALAPGGYLFLGHSESLNGFDVKLKQVAPTIYRKAGGK
jgi:chemotaxis protein methyltransferase CheR